jgi:hypothetical protein
VDASANNIFERFLAFFEFIARDQWLWLSHADPSHALMICVSLSEPKYVAGRSPSLFHPSLRPCSLLMRFMLDASCSLWGWRWFVRTKERSVQTRVIQVPSASELVIHLRICVVCTAGIIIVRFEFGISSFFVRVRCSFLFFVSVASACRVFVHINFNCFLVLVCLSCDAFLLLVGYLKVS